MIAILFFVVIAVLHGIVLAGGAIPHLADWTWILLSVGLALVAGEPYWTSWRGGRR
jgi:hypothetical protein